MELSDLQVFKAVAESGGVIKAAEKLHRVPSNVTARLQKLEEQLGVPLFLREKNRLKITSAGIRLLDYANRLLLIRQQALADITSQTPSGLLRIGSMESSAATRLPELLVRFHERFSQVELELTTGASDPLVEQVLEGRLDFALVADPKPHPRLEKLRCFDEELVVVKPSSWVEKGGESLPEPLTVVGFTRGCSYRHRLERWLESGGRVADRLVEIPSHHTMLSCVLAGMGIALVPQSVLQLHPHIHSIAVESIPDEYALAATWMVWRSDNLLPATEAFQNVMRATVGEKSH